MQINGTARRVASSDLDELWRAYYNQSGLSRFNPQQIEMFYAVFMTGIAKFMVMDNDVGRRLVRSDYKIKWDIWAAEINDIFAKLDAKAGLAPTNMG